MGLYVNPTTMSKRDWLRRNAELSTAEDAVNKYDHFRSLKQIPLAYIDNGIFDALGVCVSVEESRAFANPDGRPKQFWIVPISALEAEDSGVGVEMLKRWSLAA